jgi:hypothetical protein
MMSARSVEYTLIVVTVIFTIVAYVLERRAAEGSKRASAVNWSLCVGVLFTNLTFLIAHDAKTDQLMDERVPQVRQEPLRLLVNDIAALDRETGTASNSALNRVTMDRLRAVLSKDITDALRGVFVVKSLEETINLASDLMGQAGQRILVTSYVSPDEWWFSVAGNSYGEKTSASTKKVSEFKRIFIVDSEAERKRLMPLIIAQRAAGYDVRIAESSKLPLNLRRDMLIIDNIIAAEMTLDGERKFVEARFYTQTTKAEDLAKDFQSVQVWAQVPDDRAEPNRARPDG